MIDDLNDDNFIIYAMKAYESPHCIMSEFEGDLKRTKYLKRLFRRYKATKVLKERLIFNHLVCLNNVFGAEASAKILFFRIDERDYDILKTFLVFLSSMPNTPISINGKVIKTDEIPIDMKVAEILRNI
jgi:hypothetical protein